MFEFYSAPRAAAKFTISAVAKDNSCSVLEAFKLVEIFPGAAIKHPYLERNRTGDHICYYSDLRKIRQHYPKWKITRSLEQTIREIVEAWQNRK